MIFFKRSETLTKWPHKRLGTLITFSIVHAKHDQRSETFTVNGKLTFQRRKDNYIFKMQSLKSNNDHHAIHADYVPILLKIQPEITNLTKANQ